MTDSRPRNDHQPQYPRPRQRGPRRPDAHRHDARAHDLESPPCRVKVGSADGILAIVPHLLGFHPADSLVVLGVGGPHARIRLAFRYDLPDPPEAGLAADVAVHAGAVLARQHLSAAIIIGYGSAEIVNPVLDAVGPGLLAASVTVHDALRVQGGRYWSYLCVDSGCCPPEGIAFDVAGHPAATALAGAGLTVLADRAELARTIAPATECAEAMRQSAELAKSRASRLIGAAAAEQQLRDVYQPVADAGRRSVKLAVIRYRRGARLTDHDEIAWLGLALTDLRVRDDAWARMDPAYNSEHLRLWTDLIRHLPAEFVPAPAALLAFTAWQGGDGALASIAVDRALGADPRYSMALLIADALQAGLPPAAARLPMTPKQVAASYARRRQPLTSSRKPGQPGKPAERGQRGQARTKS